MGLMLLEHFNFSLKFSKFRLLLYFVGGRPMTVGKAMPATHVVTLRNLCNDDTQSQLFNMHTIDKYFADKMAQISHYIVTDLC